MDQVVMWSQEKAFQREVILPLLYIIYGLWSGNVFSEDLIYKCLSSPNIFLLFLVICHFEISKSTRMNVMSLSLYLIGFLFWDFLFIFFCSINLGQQFTNLISPSTMYSKLYYLYDFSTDFWRK